MEKSIKFGLCIWYYVKLEEFFLLLTVAIYSSGSTLQFQEVL